MNLAFLGDALDHWKGALFESLQVAGVFTNLAVDPMASDQADWGPEDFALYARLLRINPGQVLHHNVTLLNRRAYFEEILHPGDLFIDPDTGVATSRARKPEKYVIPTEIGHLLDHAHGRLLAVYQHVRGHRVSDRVDTVLRSITRGIGGFTWASYESATVAMIFLAREEARATAVYQHFNALLGRHVERRIRHGKY